MTHEYLFDVKLYAAIRVKAASLTEARAMLRDSFDCACCNGGVWPDGEPILFEASVDDDDLPCNEIDGEQV